MKFVKLYRIAVLFALYVVGSATHATTSPMNFINNVQERLEQMQYQSYVLKAIPNKDSLEYRHNLIVALRQAQQLRQYLYKNDAYSDLYPDNLTATLTRYIQDYQLHLTTYSSK